jgi:hypothetical protein
VFRRFSSEHDAKLAGSRLERLQGTILTEIWRCVFRRTCYRDLAPMFGVEGFRV